MSKGAPMEKIVFIIPYFGKFNNYFNLFLRSCGKNKGLCDWLIFTNDKSSYAYPDNVKVKYISWVKMQQYIQSKFDFHIVLDRPYKLCDYKPAYGYIFEEYINDYEYWGHCDTDLIWGDFNHFWKPEIYSGYKKIFNLGHCTIYHNDSINNRMFLKSLNGKERYKEVYTFRDNCSFDEEYNKSINNIYYAYNIPIFENSFAANLYTKTSDFRLVEMNESHDRYMVEKKEKNFFLWNNGSLKRYIYASGRIIEKEFLYIHFQSRRMRINLNDINCQNFKIIPNSFDEFEIAVININTCNIKNIKFKHFNMHYFILRTDNLFKKIRKRLNGE